MSIIPLVLPTGAAGSARSLAVAALVGLAVGIERQWSGHAEGPDARFAGARTFLLLGGLGGVAGWLAGVNAMALAVVFAAGAALLVVAAYVVASRRPGFQGDGTTEVAALVVVALGLVAGLGNLRVASAAGVVMVVALNQKSRIHGFIRRLDDWEIRGALQFAVLALVILPLLPKGPFGPLGGIRPQALWILVLVFSGLNFIGYVARRAVGVTRGYAYAGLLGGLVSSTVVTLNFAQRSRLEPEAGKGLAAGVVAASTVLIVRVLAIAFVLDAGTGWALLPKAAIPFAAGLLLTAWTFRPAAAVDEPTALPFEPPTNPLRLGSAIQLALLFQAAMMVLTWVQGVFGASGVLPFAALLGLTNMDVLTLSMAKVGAESGVDRLAAQAILLGLLSNTLLRLGIAVVLGAPRFRRYAAAGLAWLGVAAVIAFALA